MKTKQFKTLDEQINILKDKNLIINNEKYAKDILLRENYFFISGYRHLFLKNDSEEIYKDGTTFEEMYSLFLFDRAMRNVFFKYLLVVENNFKSIISYQLSKKYGYRERDYLRDKNFNQDPEKKAQVNDLLKKMKRQIRINGDQHSATQHYSSSYGYIPLWILVKVLSFGIVSEMYQILKDEDQNEIARIYGLDAETLTTYLPILANYRNLCAHEDILYENRTQKAIDDTIYHQKLNIPQNEEEYIYGKNDLYALIIILKQMLTYNDFKRMILELDHVLETLNYNLHTIKINKVLEKMGFPNNWKEILNIGGNKDGEEIQTS